MCKEEIAEQPEGVLKPRLTVGLGGQTTTKRKRAPTPAKEGLEFTGKFCGGLRDDLKRRAPHYLDDWLSAFTSQYRLKVLSSTFFLFFACLSPAIAFGGLFDSGTGGQLGAVEMILSSAISGVAYAIFSGQPLCILGATGPELAYTVVFYNLCNAMGLEFLPARVWQGLWTALFTVILAVTDGSSVMKMYTRFTEEIFSALISLIFIIEAFQKIFGGFYTMSLEGALLTTLLSLFTFWFAMYLKGVGKMNILTKTLRKAISDFSVTIAILTCVGLSRLWQNTDMEMLRVPDVVEPSYIVQENDFNPELAGLKRPWIIPPMGMEKPFELNGSPILAILFTAIPAVGLTILGYLDQNLTSMLINRKDHNLKKPPAYHLDLLVCGLIVYPACGFLGLPFTHAATVRSITHLKSLTDYTTEHIGDGQVKQKPEKVAEQRVSNFGIHLLIGLSLVLTKVLQLLPMAVLYGVFLFMGVGSMAGNELFERLELLLVWDRSKFPKHGTYTKTDKVWRMHFFTVLQLTCLVILYALKEIKSISVVFPFFIALLGPIKTYLIQPFFTDKEMAVLDSTGDADFEGAIAGMDEVEVEHQPSIFEKLEVREHKLEVVSLEEVHQWEAGPSSSYRFQITYENRNKYGDLEGVRQLWALLRSLGMQVDYCRQQCDESTHFSLYVIRPRGGGVTLGEDVDIATVQKEIMEYCLIHRMHVVFLPTMAKVQEEAMMYKVHVHCACDATAPASTTMKVIESTFQQHGLQVRRASMEIQSQVFIAYMLIKPRKGGAMRRQDMMDARTAVEDILGGKTSCDMLIEGIAFDRGPIGEVVHTAEDLLKPCLTTGKVTRAMELFNVHVHADSMPPAMLSSFLSIATAANLEVLSCHVDERAAIKIRAVVFRPDGQKLSSFQLKEQYVNFLTELDVTGAVEVKPLKDSATPYTSAQRRLSKEKRTLSKEVLEEIEASNASSLRGGAIQL